MSGRESTWYNSSGWESSDTRTERKCFVRAQKRTNGATAVRSLVWFALTCLLRLMEKLLPTYTDEDVSWHWKIATIHCYWNMSRRFGKKKKKKRNLSPKAPRIRAGKMGRRRKNLHSLFRSTIEWDNAKGKECSKTSSQRLATLGDRKMRRHGCCCRCCWPRLSRLQISSSC